MYDTYYATDAHDIEPRNQVQVVANCLEQLGLPLPLFADQAEKKPHLLELFAEIAEIEAIKQGDAEVLNFLSWSDLAKVWRKPS